MIGKLGTMLELLLVWNTSYIENIFLPGSKIKPVYVFREPWEKIVHVMIEQLDLDKDRDVPLITFVDTKEEIISLLQDHIQNKLM